LSCNKSALGAALATRLKRRFVDLDTQLEAQLGVTIKLFVEKEGWPAFRARELEVLQAALSASGPLSAVRGCVISCGGGVVETPAALTLLQQYSGPVLQLKRHIDDVAAYLAEDQSRPGYDVRAVWAQREPLYTQASRFEFDIERGDTNWPRLEDELFDFAASILAPPAVRYGALLRPNTFFLSLTMPDLAARALKYRQGLQSEIDAASNGCDMIELRVDLVSSTYDADKLKSYFATLRSVTRLPILWTVRSRRQGGAFVDYEGAQAAANELQMRSALELGFRLGAQMVDMESALSAASRAALYALRDRSYPNTAIISSHHEPRNNGGNSVDEVKRWFERCANAAASAGGAGKRGPEVVKVVVLAQSETDGFRLLQAANEAERAFAAASPRGPQLIAVAMGPLGRATRVYNRVLTPVTHSLMPSAAAPGQLTVEQIMFAREALALSPFDTLTLHSPLKKVLLLGAPISASMSPVLHNVAFRWLRVAPAHVYELYETDSVESVQFALSWPHFGGANVTIPLKEQVAHLMQHQSEAAKTIGAINTIVKRKDG